jgi:hypothetical protein
MLLDVPLRRDLLEIVRAELGKRDWDAVELARRIGWQQSKISRVLSAKSKSQSKLKVDDLEALLAGLEVDSQVIVRAVRAVVSGDDSAPARTTDSQETTPSDREARLERMLDGAFGQIEDLRKMIAEMKAR